MEFHHVRAATGGILAARAGPRAMASAAVVGGIILALIEGMGIWMNNYFSMPPPGMEEEMQMQTRTWDDPHGTYAARISVNIIIVNKQYNEYGRWGRWTDK